MGEYTVSQRKEQQPSLPLHRQIAQAIQQDIAQRELGPHSKLPSELELTRRYGVSHNTMNKAIGLLVHQGVLYRRRPQGTFVAAADSDELPLSGDNREQLSPLQIGFIVPYLADSFLDNIVLGVATEARTAGARLNFAYSENDWAMERYHISQFVQQGVAGIVIFPGDHPVELQDGRLVSTNGKERREMLFQLQEQHIPFVLIDRYVPEVECNYVLSDDIAAGYAATQHLISLGHQRIGLISTASRMTSGISRELGYRRALSEHGIPIDERLLLLSLNLSGPSRLPSHLSAPELDPADQAQVRTYLQRSDRPSAVLAINDYVALHVLQAAQDIGLTIPDDLAFVCCGGGDIGAFTRVPFTSILQPAADLGRQSMQILFNLIAKRTSQLQRVILPVSLIVRKSCGATERNVAFAVPPTYQRTLAE
ncbi:MAG TPA: GntR family transcriptional regulator [Ktedonobacterales bacterium]|nr:GntR family transcriptional regulator [Ktedonobacterales bacterium]